MRVPVPTGAEAQKRAAAIAAVGEVETGMLVGLGTGTTAAFAIAELGRRVEEGLRVTAAATSEETARRAREHGIPLLDFAACGQVDLCIDGVDEIDPALRAIKGGGGAMLREKVVAASAMRNIAIADASKRVVQLGARAVPVEVLPFAGAFVRRRVEALGAACAPRCARDGSGPYRTDQGNLILDCAFVSIADPAGLGTALSAIPGLLGHGLFTVEIDELFLGTPGGVVRAGRDGADP